MSANDEALELEAQLGLLYLNGCVDVPSALLVASLADLADGRVLSAVVAALRDRRERLVTGGAPAAAARPGPPPYASLADAVAWLFAHADARATAGLLAAGDVARAVRAGNRAVTVALLRVLQTATASIEGMLAHAASDHSRDGRHQLDFSTAWADVSLAGSAAAPAANNGPPPAPAPAPRQQPLARNRPPPAPVAAGTHQPPAAGRRASSATAASTAPPAIRRLQLQPGGGSSDETGPSTAVGAAEQDSDGDGDHDDEPSSSAMDITSLNLLEDELEPPRRQQRQQQQQNAPLHHATTPARGPGVAGGAPATARQPPPPPRAVAHALHRRDSTSAQSTTAGSWVARALVTHPTRQPLPPPPPPQPWNVSTALEPTAAPKRAASLAYARKSESVVVAHRVVAAPPAEAALAPASPAAARTVAAAAAALSASRVSTPATPAASGRRQQHGASDAAPPAAAGLIVGGIYDPAYRPRVLVTQPPTPGGASRQLAAAATPAAGTGWGGGSSLEYSHPTAPPLGALRPAATTSPEAATHSPPHHDERTEEEDGEVEEERGEGLLLLPTSEGLSARQRAAVAWVQRLGVELDAGARAAMGLGGGGEATLPHAHSGGAALGGSSLLAVSSALPRLMEDGVFLSELLAAAEVRAGSKLPTVAVEVGGRATNAGAATSRGGISALPPTSVVRVLPGTTVPRPGFSLSAAASSRNIDAALSLLRERPRVSPRHLYSPHELLHASTNPALAWGLLEDIYRGYRALTDPGGVLRPSPPITGSSPRGTAPARVSPAQPSTSVSAPPAATARGTLAAPFLLAERGGAALPSAAAGLDERHGDAGLQSPAAPPPAPAALLHAVHAAASAAPHSGASPARRRLKPLASEVVPPAGSGDLYAELPAALASTSRKRDVLAAAEGLRAEVRAFLEPLGLAARLDASPPSAPTLLQRIYNGTLLVELAAALEPDSPPLGPSCPPETRSHHFVAPRTVPEARANVEAALAVFRRSPTAQCVLPRTSPLRFSPGEAAAAEGARVPLPYLWATEALLRGDDAVAWALLFFIARAYNWGASRGLYMFVSEVRSGVLEAGGTAVVPAGAVATAAATPPSTGPSRRASSVGDTVAAHEALLATHESSVVSWLRTLGVLQPASDTAPAAGFESLTRSLVSGTLLVAVAARLSGLQRLPGTTVHHAASDVAARGNLRRAVEVLRRLPGFPQRVVAAPGLVQALRTGSRLETLALLQDAASWQQQQQQELQQQQQQQQPPAASLPAVSTAPLDVQLASTPWPPLVSVRGARAQSPMPTDVPSALHPHGGWPSPSTGSVQLAAHEPAVTTLVGGGALAAELRALIGRFHRGSGAAVGHHSDLASGGPTRGAPPPLVEPPPQQVDADTGATRHLPSGISLWAVPPAPAAVGRLAGPVPLSESRRASLASSTDEVAAEQRRASVSYTRVPAPGAELERLLAAAAGEGAEEETGEPPPPARRALPPAHPPPAVAPHDSAAAEAHALGAWLAALGLGDAAALAAQLGPGSDRAPAFQDGTLLAAVVQHCEDRAGLRRSCTGLDRAPRSGAARLANLRRVLEVLRDHRAMPLTHLWSELALAEGDPRVTRQLLVQVRRAYGLHLVRGP